MVHQPSPQQQIDHQTCAPSTQPKTAQIQQPPVIYTETPMSALILHPATLTQPQFIHHAATLPSVQINPQSAQVYYAAPNDDLDFRRINTYAACPMEPFDDNFDFKI